MCFVRDGKTALITGNNGSGGGGYIWNLIDGSWVENPTTVFHKSSGVTTQYGTGCDISGDGKTAIVSGSGNNEGSAIVFKLNDVGVWEEQQDLSKATTTGLGWYGDSAAISTDGKTILVCSMWLTGAGSNDGKGFVWNLGDDGVWVEHSTVLEKLSSGGQYGYACDISGDGKTVLITGNSGNTAGCGYIWTYDAVTDTWTESSPDLNKTGINGNYGYACAISDDGVTAVVTGYVSTNGGCAHVWTGVDQGERAQMTIAGASYGTLVPIESGLNYSVVVLAKDANDNMGLGQHNGSQITSLQAVDSSVQGLSSNSSLTTEILEFVFDFDSDLTDLDRFIGKVVLSNGDAFYGPSRGYQSHGGYGTPSVGNYTNGGSYPLVDSMHNDMFYKYDNSKTTGSVLVFYYEPSQFSLINKVNVNMTNTTNLEYLTKIGIVVNNIYESATSIHLDGSAIDLSTSVEVTGNFVVTFDVILAGPNQPVKLVLGVNNNTFNLNEVTFEFDGNVNDYSHLIKPTFSPLSTLSATLTSAEFSETTKELQISGEVVASDNTTIFKALATTQDNLSNDDVIALMNNASYAGAVTVVSPIILHDINLTTLSSSVESGVTSTMTSNSLLVQNDGTFSGVTLGIW